MKVLILGRPNVGKSTLFNKLAGKRIAMTQDIPGVTRDWRSHPARLGDLSFDILDSAGLLGFESEGLSAQILKITRQLVADVDVVLFMVDGRDGLMPTDTEIALLLKKSGKQVILLINKCDGKASQGNLPEFYKLGLGEGIAFSASHGLGLDELYDALQPHCLATEQESDLGEDSKTPLKLAIVGRPNAGKSTLTNALLGYERQLTGEMPGLTRDAIRIQWSFEGRAIQLADTAGIRRKAKVTDELESYAVGESFQAIQFAEVVVLVVDATSPLDKQDLVIAQHVIDEGRCLIVALNKIDQAPDIRVQELRHQLNHGMSQVRDVPLILLSALKKKNLPALMKAVLDLHRSWNRRISTADINRWLQDATQRHPAPIVKGTRVRIKYATQIKTRPPTFALFLSKPQGLPQSYVRYLLNDLRDYFDWPGVPIRMLLRKGKNPYQP